MFFKQYNSNLQDHFFLLSFHISKIKILGKFFLLFGSNLNKNIIFKNPVEN